MHVLMRDEKEERSKQGHVHVNYSHACQAVIECGPLLSLVPRPFEGGCVTAMPLSDSSRRICFHLLLPTIAPGAVKRNLSLPWAMSLSVASSALLTHVLHYYEWQHKRHELEDYKPDPPPMTRGDKSQEQR